MKSIYEIRRENLIKILTDSNESQASFNLSLGWLSTDGRISRIKNRNKRGDRVNKYFEMGSALAREIEEKRGLPEFTLDTPRDETNQNQRLIPQYATGGSMGSGLVLRDQPGTIASWSVDSTWLAKNLPSHSGAGNLCIVTGFGSSMEPLFHPGDPLLVDRGVRSFAGDAVYFFRVGDEGFVKSLQSIPSQGLRAISANREHFDAWSITPEMDFEILGRVLKVWCSREF